MCGAIWWRGGGGGVRVKVVDGGGDCLCLRIGGVDVCGACCCYMRG